MIWLLLLALAQSPGAPGRPIFIVPSGTVSSAEPAYATWTVPVTSAVVRYDISLDGGAWTRATTIDLAGLTTATERAYAASLGLLSLGPHRVAVRECAADGTCIASNTATVTAVQPTACVMGPWSPWTDWSPWVRSGANETRSHVRYRAITTFPGIGAAPCPEQNETASESRPYVPPVLDPVSVAYLRMDSTTQGAWQGTYGGLGMVSAGLGGIMPFATITVQRANIFTWTMSTADARGLQKPGSPDRMAATWYGESFEIDLRFSDSTVREVAIYAVDWDGQNRAQTIEILDTRDTVLHAVTTGSELRGGVYYVYRMSGHARIKVTKTAGSNAVVFGVLFGEAK